MARGVDIGIERAGDRIPPAVAALGGEQIDRGHWVSYIATLAHGPPAPLHGDAHIGNTYVLPDDTGRVPRLAGRPAGQPLPRSRLLPAGRYLHRRSPGPRRRPRRSLPPIPRTSRRRASGPRRGLAPLPGIGGPRGQRSGSPPPRPTGNGPRCPSLSPSATPLPSSISRRRAPSTGSPWEAESPSARPRRIRRRRAANVSWSVRAAPSLGMWSSTTARELIRVMVQRKYPQVNPRV